MTSYFQISVDQLSDFSTHQAKNLLCMILCYLFGMLTFGLTSAA